MPSTRTAGASRSGVVPAKRAARLAPTERREQLLACAVKVFAAQGLVAANHAMVAAEASVSVPTVFFYFKTREALVDAVLTEVERFYLTNFSADEKNPVPAAEALMQLSHHMTRTLQTHPDHARIMMEWSVSVRSEIWPRYLRLYRRMTRVLVRVIMRGQREGGFRADLDPEDEAAILYAGSTALIQMMEMGASAERLERFQRAMIQPVLAPSVAAKAARPRAPRAAKPKTASR